jgi:EmrB/QacA subfamily drug resistance transporter
MSNITKKNAELSMLLVVAATSFMGTFLVSAVNIALPTIERDLTLTAIELSWIITSFILGTALFMLPAGTWGDRYDNRKIFTLGLFLFTLSSIFCYLAPNGYLLIASRFIQGIGVAFTSTTGMAILVAMFPPQKRGQVLGISVASVYGGLALGPLAGGILTIHAGWRSLFLIAIIFGFLTFITSFRFLLNNNSKTRKQSGSDHAGTILFMIGLTCLVYGSSLIPSIAGWLLMGSALVLLLLFWRNEGRVSHPLLDTKLFTHNRLFTYSNLSALINYTATFAIVFFLSLYLQKIKDLSPRDAGLIIVAQPMMMAIFSPVVGKLSDKIQPRYFATAGMAMCTLGLFLLAFLSATTPIAWIVAILLWVGLGFALFSSPNMNTIMGSVEKQQYGQASGISSSMRVFGQIISMSIITFLISMKFENSSVDAVSNPIFMDVMQWSFLIFAFVGIPGIYFSYNRGNVQQKKK